MPSLSTDHIDGQTPPDGPAIIRRLMCLFAVADGGISGDLANARKLVRKWGVQDSLSVSEASFLASDGLNMSQRIQMSWRIEAMIPLMWAVGLIDDIPPPDDQTDASHLAKYWNRVPANLSRAADTRPMREMLDEAERTYRLHSSIRDAQLNETPPPKGLEPGVVKERHHGLNWLTGRSPGDWDAVTTDT